MKYLPCLLFVLFSFSFVSPTFADSNCTNIQKHNKGSVTNNCNNNSSSQNQSQTQENNQSVNVSVAEVIPSSPVTVLPHTGLSDIGLYTLFVSGAVGIYLRKKSR